MKELKANDNNRPPNFRGLNGELFLVRCYSCRPKEGRENWGLCVAAGVCAHCGWSESAESESEEQENDDER